MESRNRVEELLIWKLSDEMKLSVADEKKLSDFIRSLNKKRAEANDEVQLVLKKMAQSKDAKEKEKLLKEHRRALKVYSDLALEEADQMQKGFGSEKAVQYFVLKNDLTNRLKSLVAVPDKSREGVLPPPQVIEQK